MNYSNTKLYNQHEMLAPAHLQKVTTGIASRALHRAVTGKGDTLDASLVRAACELVALFLVAAFLPWDHHDARHVAAAALLTFLVVHIVRRHFA